MLLLPLDPQCLVVFPLHLPCHFPLLLSFPRDRGKCEGEKWKRERGGKENGTVLAQITFNLVEGKKGTNTDRKQASWVLCVWATYVFAVPPSFLLCAHEAEKSMQTLPDKQTNRSRERIQRSQHVSVVLSPLWPLLRQGAVQRDVMHPQIQQLTGSTTSGLCGRQKQRRRCSMEVAERRDWNVDHSCMHKYMHVNFNEKKENRRSKVNWLGRVILWLIYFVFRKTHTNSKKTN